MKGAREQTKDETKDHDAGRAKPGKFTEPIDWRDSQHVESDGAAVEQIFEVPRIHGLALSANVFRWLEREFEHSDIRANRGQINMERL